MCVGGGGGGGGGGVGLAVTDYYNIQAYWHSGLSLQI